MKTKPKILSRNTLAESRLFRLEEIDLEFSNGNLRKYECLHTRGHSAVMIFAVLDDTVLLVREYAVGIHDYELGLPKGLVDKGESVLDAANRELQEEAGYAAKDLQLIKTVTTAPGHFSSEMHIVVARDLYESRLPGDEPEELEVVPWRLDDLNTLVVRDDVTEARTIAALLMAHDFLKGSLIPR